MGKHSNPSDPAPVPGNVTDDTWTKLLTAAVDSDNSDAWIKNALRNAENARNN
jgi:hypothetical protein